MDGLSVGATDVLGCGRDQAGVESVGAAGRLSVGASDGWIDGVVSWLVGGGQVGWGGRGGPGACVEVRVLGRVGGAGGLGVLQVEFLSNLPVETSVL